MRSARASSYATWVDRRARIERNLVLRIVSAVVALAAVERIVGIAEDFGADGSGGLEVSVTVAHRDVDPSLPDMGLVQLVGHVRPHQRED